MSRQDMSTLSIFEPMARRRGQRTGELFERGNHWLLRYYADSTEIDDTGKPKRERVTVTLAPSKGFAAIGKRQARKMAWDQYLSPLEASTLRPSSMKTLGDFIKVHFEKDVIPTLKPTGQAFYNSILRRHITPILGNTKLREISVAQVQGLMNLKAKAGLSTQTVVHVRNCLSAILRHAKAMGWFYGELPTAAVRLPEMKRETRKALTWDQVVLLSRAATEPCATLILFLCLTGLRIGEATGLRWKRVNLTDQPKLMDAEIIPPYSIAVRESYVMGAYQSLKPGRAGHRNIPIPEWFVPALTELTTAAEILPDAPVFANSSGDRPLDQHSLAKWKLKPVAKAAGLPWVSWHTFRHTWATLSDQMGLTMAERMKILGHSVASTTLGYSHPEYEAVRLKLTAGTPKIQ